MASVRGKLIVNELGVSGPSRSPSCSGCCKTKGKLMSPSMPVDVKSKVQDDTRHDTDFGVLQQLLQRGRSNSTFYCAVAQPPPLTYYFTRWKSDDNNIYSWDGHRPKGQRISTNNKIHFSTRVTGLN